ncbi:MAG: transcription antitermination factor NusB [Ruminococcaceae bacterium]|nr:transcription antitermination factor NusB [Oscillospiraceae bacterium]
MNRTEARCEAFKLVFQITAHKDSYPDVVDMFETDNEELKKTDKKQYNYIVSTANGVFENMNTLDNMIAENLKSGWKIDRLSKVSLAVLRLALYEIVYVEDIPDRVSVNEAVELAKLYDVDEAPPFINGVLSGVLKGGKQA